MRKVLALTGSAALLMSGLAGSTATAAPAPTPPAVTPSNLVEGTLLGPTMRSRHTACATGAPCRRSWPSPRYSRPASSRANVS